VAFTSCDAGEAQWYCRVIEHFSQLDWIALVVWITVWLGWPSILKWLPGDDIGRQMASFRALWAAQIPNHYDRIADVGIARNLLASVTFFASTTVLLIGGLVGVLGASTQIVPLLDASDLFAQHNLLEFEVKVGVMLLAFISAFYKFCWSIRLHAYTTILIGSASSETAENASKISEQICALSSLAAHHYTMGLHTYYLSSALFAWLIDPLALLIVLATTSGVLIRRESFSKASRILKGEF
jgi:uncharacterized membrane protein